MARREHLDLEVARWLVGAEGLAAVAAATARLDAGDDVLRIGTDLRAAGFDPSRSTAVTGAAAARRHARDRWPQGERLLFTPAGLEQASDPAVSAWRARRLVGPRVEDRAAGLGGDTLAIARTGAHVTAVDLDAARLVLLAHNAAVAGVEVETVVDDALRRPPPAAGPVHVDPARRVDGRRVRRLADHAPSVPALLEHLASSVAGDGVAVVLSPAVDLRDPDLPPDAELEFVQVGTQLVETVAWTGRLRTGAGARATATLLDRHAGGVVASHSRGPRGPELPVGPVGEVLLDVAPAAVRARLHDELGAEVGARRIAAGRALLTVDATPDPNPWWTARRVEATLPARPNAVKRWLRTVEARPLELAVHGADVDVETFRRALGRPPRGPGGRRIELVRLDAAAVAIATVPLVPNG
ncbi:hypothetical protein FTX61_15855 [Nitriliruptoraceae bacterium ZYF776]|nr:hypothetical protein [Profundirhabdus halotolerans]